MLEKSGQRLFKTQIRILVKKSSRDDRSDLGWQLEQVQLAGQADRSVRKAERLGRLHPDLMVGEIGQIGEESREIFRSDGWQSPCW